jgi:hypothetical protein
MFSRLWIFMDVWSASCSSNFALEKGHSNWVGGWIIPRNNNIIGGGGGGLAGKRQ